MIVIPVVASTLLAAIVVAAVLEPDGGRRIDGVEPGASPTTRRRWLSWARSLRRRRSTLEPAEFGRWADEIARNLRHGSTVRAALVDVVPDDHVLRDRTAPLRHRLDRGATVTGAADEWADEVATRAGDGAELIVGFAAVIGATAQLGGSASTPLERFAVTMRQHVSDDLERRAQSAQAMLSARVLTLVPLAMLVILLLTDADVRRVLGQPGGALLVGIGLTLNSVGGWWMRRIVGDGTRRSR